MKVNHPAPNYGGRPLMTLWVTLVVGILSGTLLLQWFLPDVASVLRWQADLMSGQPVGQYWRLVSGHFVHLGVLHGVFNCLALLLLWQLFANDWRQRSDVIIMAFSIPLTSVLLLASEYSWYVGFSGVLHGWFLLGALRLWPKRRGFAAMLVGLLLIKLWWEPNNPAAGTEAEWIGGPIAYVAHQAGAAAVILLFACAGLWDRVRR